jgi:hypothetical protein
VARFKDRPDGVLLTRLPGFRKMFPFLMRTRTEAYIHYEQRIRVAKALALLERLNEGRTGPKYTLFHVVLAAAVRIFALRPDAHRFVAGRRIYQRRHIELSFVTKRQMTDTAGETNVKLRFEPTDTLPQVAQRVWDAVSVVTSLVMAGWRFLDHHNLLPASAIQGDSLYCSAYLANLGSIGLDAVQHHLFEWGTCPFFVVIGRIRKEAVLTDSGESVIEDVATSSYTLDERITDGVSYARIIGRLVQMIENPEELLAAPESLPDPLALA